MDSNVHVRVPAGLAQEDLLAVCRHAEESGYGSVLVPIVRAAALGRQTRRIGFMVECRPAWISPAFFVQQVNTLSTLLPGRVHVCVVAEREDSQTAEFLSVCRRFWSQAGPVDFEGQWYRIEKGRILTPFVSSTLQRPLLFLDGGGSRSMEYADCLWVSEDRGTVEALCAAGIPAGVKTTVARVDECREWGASHFLVDS